MAKFSFEGRLALRVSEVQITWIKETPKQKSRSSASAVTRNRQGQQQGERISPFLGTRTSIKKECSAEPRSPQPRAAPPHRR